MTLPETALRRSWIVKQLQRYCNPFAVLLAQLAPRVWAQLVNAPTQAVYYALLEECGRRFPVFDPYFDSDDDPTEYDSIDEWLQFGIPIDLLGIGDEEIEYGISPTFGFIGYLIEPVEGRTQPHEFRYGLGKSWKNIAALRPFYELSIRQIHAPRGRAWSGEWKAITALAEYVMHDTGNWMLDVSNQGAVEDYGEDGYPPWTIEDIRNCEREYKRAQPVLKSILALRDYVDARPAERLPLLAAALTGDRDVRMQLSRPKRDAPRTLAEVFKG